MLTAIPKGGSPAPNLRVVTCVHVNRPWHLKGQEWAKIYLPPNHRILRRMKSRRSTRRPYPGAGNQIRNSMPVMRRVSLVPPRVMSASSGGQDLVVRRVFQQAISTGAAATQGYFINFNPVTNLPSFAADFAAFEQYKLLGAQVKYVPLFQPPIFANAAPVAGVPVWFAFDPIDNTVPTTVAQMQQYGTNYVVEPFKRATFRIRPTVLRSDSAGNDAVEASSVWMNIASAPVMYGLKILVDNFGTANATAVGFLEVTLLIALRGVF